MNHNLTSPITIKTSSDFSLTSVTENKYITESKPTYSSYTSSMTSTGSNYIIIMKGTVGSGKTTFANILQKKILRMGVKCICEGIDKYCRIGTKPAKSSKIVERHIRKFKENRTNKLLVLIMDTCEGVNQEHVFNNDLSGWIRIDVIPNLNIEMFDQYMAWSLRNVLIREKANSLSNYWLNPVDVPANKCMEIHNRKASNIFSKVIPMLSTKYIISEIINDINDKADEYAEYLKHNLDLETETDKIVSLIK
jgi:hypothetical protein